MAESIGQSDLYPYLTAFADGELDAAQNLKVLDYLAAHPEAISLMKEQQKLRLEAARVIRSNTPPAPASLRECITRLCSAAPVGLPQTDQRNPPTTGATALVTPKWPRSGWMPSVAAMLLLVGGGIIGAMMRGAGPTAAPGPHDAPLAALPVPLTLVDSVVRVHVDCSRFVAPLHAAKFPQELGPLATAIRQDLGRDVPYPDLSTIGYELIGAGPCHAPLKGIAHLLYRSTAKDVRDTLSVFVQPYTAQLTLEPGKAYLVSLPGAAHPVLAWRTERVIYFAIGDDLEPVRGVARVVGIASILP